METVWDPLRKKNVALTPEEGVRQWFIEVLHKEYGYPYHLMQSEVSFTFGEQMFTIAGGARQKVYRADIVVYDRDAKPFMIVECKRPQVPITLETAHQAARYNLVLNVSWLVLTNGGKTLAFRREGDKFVPSAKLPSALNNEKNDV